MLHGFSRVIHLIEIYFWLEQRHYQYLLVSFLLISGITSLRVKKPGKAFHPKNLRSDLFCSFPIAKKKITFCVSGVRETW